MFSGAQEVGSLRHRYRVHQAREVRDVPRQALHHGQAEQGVRVGAGALLQHHRGGLTGPLGSSLS